MWLYQCLKCVYKHVFYTNIAMHATKQLEYLAVTAAYNSRLPHPDNECWEIVFSDCMKTDSKYNPCLLLLSGTDAFECACNMFEKYFDRS